jgi:hypothetical protein
MGQHRVARAEDLEGRTDDAEFRLEGSGHIDLSENTEALGSQRLANGALGALGALDGVGLRPRRENASVLTSARDQSQVGGPNDLAHISSPLHGENGHSDTDGQASFMNIFWTSSSG